RAVELLRAVEMAGHLGHLAQLEGRRGYRERRWAVEAVEERGQECALRVARGELAQLLANRFDLALQRLFGHLLVPPPGEPLGGAECEEPQTQATGEVSVALPPLEVAQHCPPRERVFPRRCGEQGDTVVTGHVT